MLKVHQQNVSLCSATRMFSAWEGKCIEYFLVLFCYFSQTGIRHALREENPFAPLRYFVGEKIQVFLWKPDTSLSHQFSSSLSSCIPFSLFVFFLSKEDNSMLDLCWFLYGCAMAQECVSAVGWAQNGFGVSQLLQEDKCKPGELKCRGVDAGKDVAMLHIWVVLCGCRGLGRFQSHAKECSPQWNAQESPSGANWE